MTSFANFAEFIRRGGQASLVLRLQGETSLPEVKEVTVDSFTLSTFEMRLHDVSKESWAYLLGVFQRAKIIPDPEVENVDELIFRHVSNFESLIADLPETDSPSNRYDKIAEISDQLTERFSAVVNQWRQQQLGVTHYIWRSRDDIKVRAAHAERDDRLFSWDNRFSDGHPGDGYNCRCFAEPAILDGAILLTDVRVAVGLSARIATAEGQGLQDALLDTLADGVRTSIPVVRYLYLGVRDFGGDLRPAEEAELRELHQKLSAAIKAVENLDADAVESLAHAFVEHVTAQHADLRQLDLEYRLGLVSEETLLRAYRDVAYLDASTALGGIALTTAAAKLGVRLARAPFRITTIGILAAATRVKALLPARRQTTEMLIARRFAELETQGHGPQRHEGAVTKQMLEDRVLRGIDPMTGTTMDGEKIGRTHSAPRAATRFKTEEAFVVAETHIRRSSIYRDLRDESIHSISVRRGSFEVEVSLEDALGLNYANKVEGVRRVGSRRNPFGTEEIDFKDGIAVAIFKFSSNGEPQLITMYPVGN
ncbi:hypothetical protein JJJ17_01740 [Paracoccus caeni]|uniref:Phage head morphogenesis domain-containing protein n=1 Tax=Paracoccus caeni TaxID=657651 RepID=A0A934SFV8_9RHOB|nr:phage minor head protein [Paracoccus caeni]MBK4214642.1 hypothetical protein [Paracoccus caeni]